MTKNNLKEPKVKVRDEPENDLPKELAKPAQRALAGAGYFQLEQLTKLSDDEVMQLHGMGPKAMEQIRRALDAKGLTFNGSS